jgi:hypothetical protein
MALTGDWKTWRHYHKQGHVRDAITAYGGTQRHTGTDCAICAGVFTRLHPQIGVKPMTFANKVSGEWVNVPQVEAERRLGNYVREVHAYMTGTDKNGVDLTPDTGCGGCDNGECCQNGPVGGVCACCGQPIPAPEPEPIQAGSELTADERELIRRLRALRVFAAERDIDHISLRPVQDGRRMLRVGIPIDGILSACTMHWDAADRRQAGVRDWTPERDFPGGRAAYLDALVEAGILIYLYGPAGMGKSYWAKDLARRRDVPYGFSPMTEGASVGWLLGRVDLQGFKSTKLLEMWGNEGVYLFDEADAADANMMLVMNGPLADDEGRLDNPIDGQTYYRDPRKTVLIFAGNTDGTGADSQYNARNPFDFSTFDRVRMGRVHVGYDEDVEMAAFMAA